MLRDRLKQALTTLLLAAAAQAQAGTELGISEGTNISVSVTPDGSHLVFDLYGLLWRLPAAGGMAEPITGPELRLTRPDVGPHGRIVAEGDDGNGQKIWLVEPDGSAASLAVGAGRDAHPRWHPSGDRVIFASDRAGSWDLYEIGVGGGTLVRLTDTATDETEPAVSARGNRLAWITRTEQRWELWTRSPVTGMRLLYSAPHRLSAPAIRPDESVILVVEEAPEGRRLTAVILSDPAVAKPLAGDEDYFRRPAAWLDRERLIYTADGGIRLREFGELGSRDIHWTAWITVAGPPGARSGLDGETRQLHHGRYVIRAGRAFDGRTPGYRGQTDVLIENDRIAAVTPAGEIGDRADADVLEFPDAVLMPGLLQLGLDKNTASGDGASLLACGVTTVIQLPAAPGEHTVALPAWNDGSAPGPALLSGGAPAGGLVDVRDSGNRAERLQHIRQARATGAMVITDRLYPDLAAGASLLAMAGELPASPAGHRYADIRRLLEASGTRIIQGSVADAPSVRRSPACAVQRQLLQAQRTGALPWEALRLHTDEAARLVGLAGERGVLVPGARADLLLVAGDPLTDAADTAAVRAVIAGGRFFTPAGLAASGHAAHSSAASGESSENLTINDDSEPMSPIRDRFDTRRSVLGNWRSPPVAR